MLVNSHEMNAIRVDLEISTQEKILPRDSCRDNAVHVKRKSDPKICR